MAQVLKYHFTLKFNLPVIIDNKWDIEEINLLTEGDVVGVLVIFMLFHIYCSAFFTMLYMNKSRDT
jgi:hypothetical protein